MLASFDFTSVNRSTSVYSTFGNIIFVSLGFSALDTLVKGTLPQNGEWNELVVTTYFTKNISRLVLGVFWFILAGWVLSRFKHMRCAYDPSRSEMIFTRSVPSLF